MNYKELVSNLSPDEYLNFILDTVFSFYQDKGLLLSIYDKNKQLRFTTDKNMQLHHIIAQDLDNVTAVDVLYDERHLKKNLMAAIDCVFSQHTHVSGIVFARFHEFIGIIHAQLTPLFYKDEVCGVLIQKTIVSRLIYSITPISKRQTFEKKLAVKLEQIKSLSERECDVLFLSLLNYSMPETAKLLAISEGTVRTYVTRICDKFYIPNSLTYLQNNLDRLFIINNLPLPNIKFRPISIITVGDKESFLTAPNMGLARTKSSADQS